MKPVDVTPNANIYFEKKNEDPQLKVGVHGRILKYKNIFEKDYIPNWSEKVFVSKKLKRCSVEVSY